METNTVLIAILALLVAERDGNTRRPTERILAGAGAAEEHITMLTGRDPSRPQQPPVTAFGHTVAQPRG